MWSWFCHPSWQPSVPGLPRKRSLLQHHKPDTLQKGAAALPPICMMTPITQSLRRGPARSLPMPSLRHNLLSDPHRLTPAPHHADTRPTGPSYYSTKRKKKKKKIYPSRQPLHKLRHRSPISRLDARIVYTRPYVNTRARHGTTTYCVAPPQTPSTSRASRVRSPAQCPTAPPCASGARPRRTARCRSQHGRGCGQTTYLSMRSGIAGGSLVIAFALSHFWWQRKAKGARNGSVVGMRRG